MKCVNNGLKFLHYYQSSSYANNPYCVLPFVTRPTQHASFVEVWKNFNVSPRVTSLEICIFPPLIFYYSFEITVLLLGDQDDGHETMTRNNTPVSNEKRCP